MAKRSVFRPFLFTAVAAAAALWIWNSEVEYDPACTFRVGSGGEAKPARNYAELPAETPFRIAATPGKAKHFYVFSHNVVDGTVLLWPSPDLRSDLGATLDRMATLPGRVDDKDLAWTTRSELRGTTVVVAIAAAAPIPELDVALPRLRRWTNSVLTDRSMLVTKPKAGEEPLGPPLSSEFPLLLLKLAAQATITRDDPNGPMTAVPGHDDVWCAGWRFTEVAGSGTMQNPLKPQDPPKVK